MEAGVRRLAGQPQLTIGTGFNCNDQLFYVGGHVGVIVLFDMKPVKASHQQGCDYQSDNDPEN